MDRCPSNVRAHLLDDASATLLHQAVTTGAAVVVATVATGEPAPDSVVALWKDELLARERWAEISAANLIAATAFDPEAPGEHA